jgi:hypothetical protein
VHCDLLESAAEFDKICRFVVDLTTRCHEEDNFSNAECTKIIGDLLPAWIKSELDVSS